jgi:SAM-dependent methyltransferase
VRSLNPVWSLDDFHARVAGLAGVGGGARVLDLGCGRGLTVPHLLAGAAGLGRGGRRGMSGSPCRDQRTVFRPCRNRPVRSRKSLRSVFRAGGDRRMRLRFRRNSIRSSRAFDMFDLGIFDLGIHDHSSDALLLLAIAAFVAALARGFSAFGSALIFVPLCQHCDRTAGGRAAPADNRWSGCCRADPGSDTPIR